MNPRPVISKPNGFEMGRADRYGRGLTIAMAGLAYCILAACSAPRTSADTAHVSERGAVDSESEGSVSGVTQEDWPEGAVESELSQISVEDDRFLRRIVPDYDDLMMVGDVNLAFDAWAHAALGQGDNSEPDLSGDERPTVTVWFPGPSGCFSATLTQYDSGWIANVPICPDLPTDRDITASCRLRISESIEDAGIAHMENLADGSGTGGIGGDGCEVPNLSPSHWVGDRLTFAGVCTEVHLSCYSESTTQVCLDGSQRTCTRCTSVRTELSECGYRRFAVANLDSTDITQHERFDCRQPCDTGPSPDQVERANQLLSGVSWMQPADVTLNIYRTAESCAADVGSIHISEQEAACSALVHNLGLSP